MKKAIDTNTLTAIADAIRAKDGSSAPINVSDFANRILSITGGSSVEYSITNVMHSATESNTERSLFNGRSVEHGLSSPPNLVLVVRDGDSIPPTNVNMMYLTLAIDGAFGLFPFIITAGYGGGNAIALPYTLSAHMTIDEQYVTFAKETNNKSYMQGGVNYKFIFMHIEDTVAPIEYKGYTTSVNMFALSDDLPNGTRTLRYEDEDGNLLDTNGYDVPYVHEELSDVSKALQ